MDPSSLMERLVRLDPSRPVPHAEDFDPSNDLHLDSVAGWLLERFQRENDVEALALLFELTHERLALIATQIVRKLALAADPDDLVMAFLSRLFTDVRRPVVPVRRFLGLAHTAMRNEALNQLRSHTRSLRRMVAFQATMSLPRDPAQAADDREQMAAVLRVGVTMLAVVNRCFHELSTRDRRVLLARELEGRSYQQVADEIGVPANQIGTIIRRARRRLAERMAASLAAWPGHDDAWAADTGSEP